MSGILRGLSAVRSVPVVRSVTMSQRANLANRAAKDPLGPAETAIGLTLFSLAILGPSGWILANLESYKKKE
ncbi:cytochrome c oxidase subunit 8B, mitochondrial [Alosa sapidissima]|uniref:cytochrome c oxidase subunit 8B, mitochondrial n=1 Tax=Alosa sapidissima TaxID=34773 RepID=UPI001C07FF2B|nr:cytochrome c oxidase subunit 8B, mitochondrial [Alosa sapidissima]